MRWGIAASCCLGCCYQPEAYGHAVGSKSVPRVCVTPPNQEPNRWVALPGTLRPHTTRSGFPALHPIYCRNLLILKRHPSEVESFPSMRKCKLNEHPRKALNTRSFATSLLHLSVESRHSLETVSLPPEVGGGAPFLPIEI